MENLELYQEEQREYLIKMNEGITILSDKFQTLIDSYEVVKQVEVTGSVEVNTEKSIEVSNIIDLQESIDSLKVTMSKAIENNSYKPLESVTVKNIKDALPTELKITNLSDIKQYFINLEQSIKNNQPIVNVAKQDIVFPTDPKKPIPVRFSDGKKFIDALTVAIGGGINTQGIIDAINDISITGGSGGDVTVLNFPSEYVIDSTQFTSLLYTIAENAGQTDALTDLQLRTSPVAVDTELDLSALATISKQDEIIAAIVANGSTNYKTLVDKATTNIIYIGKAPIGTSTGSGSWQIKKIDKTVTDNVTITYAAAGAFTATWTNRGSETYS